MTDDVYMRRGRRRRGTPRAVTVAAKGITRASLREFPEFEYAAELAVERPKTRGECRGDPRPCPWVGCRFHLFIDVNPETGSLKFNYPTLQPWQMGESCALDIAEQGGHTLDEVGLFTNLTRERIRQIEVRGLLKIKRDSSHELGT